MMKSFIQYFLIALTILSVIAGMIMSWYYAATVSWVLVLVVIVVEFSILTGFIGMIVDYC